MHITICNTCHRRAPKRWDPEKWKQTGNDDHYCIDCWYARKPKPSKPPEPYDQQCNFCCAIIPHGPGKLCGECFGLWQTLKQCFNLPKVKL